MKCYHENKSKDQVKDLRYEEVEELIKSKI
jgi:hypothetical protein